MSMEPRYAPLFEPIRLGPVTAPNRFYQVPHCTGMGYALPRTLAAMRGVKAEGGWGVVCSEYCSIHASSDDSPFPYASLWDDDDVRAMALSVEAVHAHAALAGVELWHGGGRSANLLSRETPMDVGCRPVSTLDPLHARAMDHADIRALRRWHRAAAERALAAGYDIVYVYATHDYLLGRFLDPVANTRSDEYGGSLVNRVRLVRELIEETGDALAGRAALAVRWSADDPGAVEGERREMFSMLAELPDLWDINIDDYEHEMGSSRFHGEASLEPLVSWVKPLTSKPVVSVGRFTSPDTMLAQIRRGVMDLVGAARPSIADPFLPRKIAEGRVEDIRECIGCNVCYAGDASSVPIRCTQNPTMGEEWRRGWHPERIPAAKRPARVLVVGAGPAGLECARALAVRGHRVSLAEAREEAGGRVSRECRLPGLAAWARVRDWRLGQIAALPGVDLYLASRMSAETVREFAAEEPTEVVLATGAHWRRDGVGHRHLRALDTLAGARVLTPDDVMDGAQPDGDVLVYDDDHYYMGAVMAMRLADTARSVTLVTPGARVGEWSARTDEQFATQQRVLQLGVRIVTATELLGADAAGAHLGCIYSGAQTRVAIDTLLLVTAREPCDSLYPALLAAVGEGAIAGVRRVGDCLAPGAIVHAVHAGHRLAREWDETEQLPARRERAL